MVKKHVKPARKSPASRRASRRPRKPAAQGRGEPASRRRRRARKRTPAEAPAPPPPRPQAGERQSVAGNGKARGGSRAKPKAGRRKSKLRRSRPASRRRPPRPTSRTRRRRPPRTAAGRQGARRRASRRPARSPRRIAGKRAEDAAHKKGRNGKHAEVAPRELTPADVEARKRRLKTLIMLGKERGYLTYAEINDHLPDDIVDAEQIEAHHLDVRRHGHPGLRRRRPTPRRC